MASRMGATSVSAAFGLLLSLSVVVVHALVRVDDTGFGAWRVEEAAFQKQGPECMNGGTRTKDGVFIFCACPPGFTGATCQEACGPNRYGNRYGARCHLRCSSDSRGCQGKRFCEGNTCSCAAGFSGTDCGKFCRPGSYGSNCTESCGNCAGNANCDPYTGHCPDRCHPGYMPPSCQEERKHLVSPPTLFTVGSTYVVGFFDMDPRDIRGSGPVEYWQVQHKLAASSEWRTLSRMKIDLSSAGSGFIMNMLAPSPAQLKASLDFSSLDAARHVSVQAPVVDQKRFFIVQSLTPDTEVDLRVLLLAEDGDAHDRVPYLRVKTAATPIGTVMERVSSQSDPLPELQTHQ